ncbi:Predicted arabinose efflux permease, MFS family [Aquisalimonas asiatica]|uniref:Predicted arabinose efflux permease, MFS family n=2 Tax=Aquisalimonas asiatica TaxID=406100 RepID=A0A1H8Q0Z6_9GAMM|nr:Predicted arabinose efflux permease, MFS family [Aquisalimonas asiatica]
MNRAAVTPWHLVPAGLAIVAATYGLARYTYGLFLPDIRSDLGLSLDVLGLIGSLSYAGYLVATLAGSVIAGSLGPRLPVVLGGLAATAGMALIAASRGPWLLAAGVFLAGTSPGLAYPPLSDAVARLIAAPQQARTYALINAGTSVGVIVAGPVALLVADDWRLAWLAFAGFAAVATAWNAPLMPRGPYPGVHGGPQPLALPWLINRRSLPLFAAATLFGLATAVYWTFAVDLVTHHGGLPDAGTRAFWVLMGAAGLLGGAAGDLVRRYGLRGTFTAAVLACAGAILLLAVCPHTPAPVLLSGTLFGATFILVTGLFGIWSVHTFPERPSAGFGATFFLISAGQLVAPTVAGLLGARLGLASAFLLAATLSVVCVPLAPRQAIHTMLPATDTNPTTAGERH